MENAGTTNRGHRYPTGRDMAHDDGLIGRRVVVRSLVPGERGPSGGPAMTDVIGVLESADEIEVTVRRSDGTSRRVARADLLVVKAVPPPPQPRSRTRSGG